MNNSIYISASGLKTYQSAFDIFGYNTANIDTVGFKQVQTEFHTLFSSSVSTVNAASSNVATSDTSYGSGVMATATNLEQGSLVSSSGEFDMAIEGSGWFAVTGAEEGEVYYTRNGQFHRDVNSILAMETGEKLLGVSAGNLIENEDGSYTIDPNIDTDNLIDSTTPTLGDIFVPSTLNYPAQATQNVTLSANVIAAETDPRTKAVTQTSDFSAIYDSEGEDLKMSDGESVYYGFGDQVSYDDGVISYEYCLKEEDLEGHDVTIDFDVNGVNISTTIPQGTSRADALSMIAAELGANGILYDLGDDLNITSSSQLVIESNDVVTLNAAAAILTYKESADTTQFEFKTMGDFTTELNALAQAAYGSDAEVTLEEGAVKITNSSEDNMMVTMASTGNTNSAFFESMTTFRGELVAGSELQSQVFTQVEKVFSHEIFDANGDKNTLQMTFTHVSDNADESVWSGEYTLTDDDSNVISTQTSTVTFDTTGYITSGTLVTFDNNGTEATLDLTDLSAFQKATDGYEITQDGFEDGDLQDYSLANDGSVYATFTNGYEVKLAQIPLYHFANEQGLDRLEKTLFSETVNSNKATLYFDSEGEYLSGGLVELGFLEASNVNFSEAMTEAVIQNKAFNATSKSFTVSDELLQKAINMKE